MAHAAPFSRRADNAESPSARPTREAPFSTAGLASVAAAALVGGGGVMLLLERLMMGRQRRLLRAAEDNRAQAEARGQLENALAVRVEQQRRLRHDLRGALSPVLLIADRLLNHADPAVKRSAGILVRTVDRTTALLNEPLDAEVNPPVDP